ncbi:hypothetical protein [Arthrobacter sp. 9MFCol3.1]|jgi:hypothetical protein|uniref:hypothetical protein n=1 Tax=Arthrobacter sp. 9MFCol3.1 TaxID=1150398 RepID=UPI000479A803|nr:hypothetical protein [Arthrobacter sp. 9MFCol3.1]
MDFNPGTWGTVADWVGGLGTTAAFIAAVVVIAKDAKVRRIAQARKVVYITLEGSAFEKDEATGQTRRRNTIRYVLKNLSDEPVYSVRFIVRSGPYRGLRLGAKDVVLPGEDFACKLEADDPPVAVFRDNSDVRWVRNIKGKIHPISSIWLTEKDAAYVD